jgi:hypothetical protein
MIMILMNLIKLTKKVEGILNKLMFMKDDIFIFILLYYL